MALKIGSLYVALDAEVGAFGKKMQSVAASIDQLSKRVKRMASEVASAGAAVTAFATGMLLAASKADSGVRKALDELKGSFTALAVEVSRVLLPALEQLSHFLQLAAGWFRGLSPETKGFISDLAVAAVSVGGVAFVLSKLAPLVGIVAQGFGLIGAAIAALGLPGIAVIALLVAGAALIHKAWRENWGGIQEMVKGVVEKISGFFAKLADWLTTDFINAIVDVAAAIGSAFAKAQIWAKWGMNLMTSGERNQQLALVDQSVNKQAAGFKAPGGILKPLMLEAEAVAASIKKFGGSFVDELVMMAKEIGGPLAEAIQKFLASIKPVGPPGPRPHAGEHGDEGQKHEGDHGDGGGGGHDGHGDHHTEHDQKPIDAIHEESDRLHGVVKALADGMAEAGYRMLSKLGDLGTVIDSALQGFQSGGVVGAVMAVFIELLSRFERFQEIMDIGNGQVAQLIEQLKPAFNVIIDALRTFMGASGILSTVVINLLSPILKALGSAFQKIVPIIEVVAVLLSSLQPVFEFLGVVIGGIGEALGYVTRFIGVAVLATFDVVLGVWQSILKFAHDMLVELGMNQDALNVSKMMTDTAQKRNDIEAQMKNLWENGTTGIADAAADASEQLGKMGKAAEDAGRELSSVPDGFKVLLAEFNSTLATSSSGGGPKTGSYDLWELSHERVQFRSTGNPKSGGGTSSRPKNADKG